MVGLSMRRGTEWFELVEILAGAVALGVMTERPAIGYLKYLFT